MISWWWLIPVFFFGCWIGSFGDKTMRGVGLGVIGTLLALIGL